MPHKYQIMTNLIFTIPPPYTDEGIIAILTLQKGYGDTMTLTSKVYINFGMQSSRFTQHDVLLSMFKAFLFLAPVMAPILQGFTSGTQKMSKLMTTCKRLC